MFPVVSALVMVFLLASAPVAAAPFERDGEHWSLNDVLRRGADVLNEVVTEGLAALDDHVDFDVRMRRGTKEGERATRFHFNVFPHGKMTPAERYGIEGTLRYSEEGRSALDLHLRLIEPERLNQDPL
jgi:hypothetical protein